MASSVITPSFVTEQIAIKGKVYALRFPLRCSFAQEDGYYIITCEMLDIIGTGSTQAEAEANFNQEFDYIYTRYHALAEAKLSNRLLQVKQLLQFLIQSIV